MDRARSSARMADRGRSRRAPHHALPAGSAARMVGVAHDRRTRRFAVAGWPPRWRWRCCSTAPNGDRRWSSRVGDRRAPRAPGRQRTLDLLAPFDDDFLTAQHSPLMSPLAWDLAHIGNYEDQWLVRALGGARRRAAARRSLRRVPASPRRPSRIAVAELDAGARVRRRGSRAHADAARPRGRTAERPALARRRLRVRDGDPARAPARRDDARHDPAVERADRCRRRPAADRRRRHGARRRWPVRDGHEQRTVGVRQRAAGARGRRRPVLDRHRARHQPRVRRVHRRWRLRRRAALASRRMAMASRGTRDRAVVLGRRRQRAAVRRASRATPTSPCNTCAGTRPTRSPAGPASACRPRRNGRRPLRATPARCGSGRARRSRRGPASNRSPTASTPRCSSGPSYKVLRGGSWATHAPAIRPTFRNWDYPIRRQIFSGFRCAQDA